MIISKDATLNPLKVAYRFSQLFDTPKGFDGDSLTGNWFNGTYAGTFSLIGSRTVYEIEFSRFGWTVDAR